MIDITGVDLVKFAQKVYELSAPKGLGFLQYTSGGLSADDAAAMISDGKNPLSMDYVGGRCCKMNVFREGDRLMIRDSWFDHTDEQLKQLLSFFGITAPGGAVHGFSCECSACATKRVQAGS